MTLKRLLVLFFLFAFPLFGLAVNAVIIKPFPFLSIDYVSKEEWEKPPEKGIYNFYKKQIIVPKSLQNKVLEIENVSDKLKIIWAVEIARSLLRNSFGEEVRDEKTVLKNSNSLQSICSEASKVFTTLINLVGLPSRVVWMNGHTTSEVYLDNKWVMIDSYGNVKAVNDTGELLGVIDIIKDIKSVEFQIVTKDNYLKPANFLDRRIEDSFLRYLEDIYSDQKLAVVIDRDYLFSFHLKNRSPTALLKSVLGIDKEAVGKGKQLIIDGYFVGNYQLSF